MKEKKYAIPTWAWELRSRTLSFLKKRREMQESFSESIIRKTTPKTINIERFLDAFSTRPTGNSFKH